MLRRLCVDLRYRGAGNKRTAETFNLGGAGHKRPYGPSRASQQQKTGHDKNALAARDGRHGLQSLNFIFKRDSPKLALCIKNAREV